MKAFRFGVAIQEAASLRDWTEKVKRAEAQGFDVLTMADHFSDQFAPFVALSSAAAATTTLRLGTLVIDNDFRHPAVLAKEVATLDVLSAGRVELGLGAGWRVSEYEQTGIPFDPSPVRVARFEESVRVLKGLMGDGPLSFEGKHYRIAGLEGQPKPLQRPTPPILIAGSRKRMLTFAAREADIVGLHILLDRRMPIAQRGTTMTAAAMAEQLAWVREAAGGRFTGLELQALVFHVALDVAWADIAPIVEERFGIPVSEAPHSPHLLGGSLDDIVETLLERRARYGLSYFSVNERDQAAMAKVIARLRD